jgi:sigma-B regulation protein RsbQ
MGAIRACGAPLPHSSRMTLPWVLFDYVGAGLSDPNAFHRTRYSTLQGYAGDVLTIISELNLTHVTFVGHSVSPMIGALAAIEKPEAFDNLVMIGPSPCYVSDGDYVGGFERADIMDLLDTLDNNHLGWSSIMAPVIMGNSDRPELAAELETSFCRTDPVFAQHLRGLLSSQTIGKIWASSSHAR